MTNAFVPSTNNQNKMDNSLVQDENKVFFKKVELEKFDNILDMSSSVGTTAASSSASSFYTPEQYQYSLRKVLVSNISWRIK